MIILTILLVSLLIFTLFLLRAYLISKNELRKLQAKNIVLQIKNHGLELHNTKLMDENKDLKSSRAKIIPKYI